MPALPLYIPAPPTAPAKYNLLDSIGPQPLPDKGALAGVQYDTEFCGVARPWVAPCVTQETVEASVSVDATGLATISAPGAPAGDYTVRWGDGTTEVVNPVNGATHQYASAGDWPFSVSAEGLQGATVVTVTSGVATGPFAVDLVAVKVPDDGIDQTVGEPITVYHLFSCRLVGSTDPDGRARRSLDLGASRAVEEGFGQVIAADAVDITPGGTITPARAVAAAEEYAGDNYGGTPVLHMNRELATMAIADDVVERNGDRLETVLGTLVIAGAGYPDGVIQVTGEVHVWEGETLVVDQVLNVPYDNEFTALAERIYVPTYECIAASVTINLEA